MTLRSLLIASLVVSVSSGCTPSAPAVDTAADGEVIRAIVADYFQALNDGVLEACVAMYAADAVFMPNDAPQQNGLAAIRTFYQATTLLTQFELTSETTDVQVSADVAWATVSIGGRQTPPDGETFSVDSKALFLFRRVPSGNWEVIRYIYNPNAPLPTGGP